MSFSNAFTCCWCCVRREFRGLLSVRYFDDDEQASANARYLRVTRQEFSCDQFRYIGFVLKARSDLHHNEDEHVRVQNTGSCLCYVVSLTKKYSIVQAEHETIIKPSLGADDSEHEY